MRQLFPLLSAVIAFAACSDTPQRAPSSPVPSSERSPASLKAEQQLHAALEEFKNRKIYRKLSLETLAAISDDKLEQAIIDFIAERITANDGDEQQTLKSLSLGFRVVYSTWLVEAEGNNGGFNQFFWNSSGEYAEDAVQGFALIGAPGLSTLMRQAIEINERNSQRIAALKQRGTLEAFSESYENDPFSALDRRFFEPEVDVSELRIKYIRANPNLFVAE